MTAIARYLIPHAVVAFETMLGGQALADAKRLMEWATRQQRDEFSRRDARCAFHRSIQRAPECDSRLGQALALLLAMGRIAEKEPEPAQDGWVRLGRPHSRVYIILTEVN